MRLILSMLMLVCCATATQAENHWLFVTLLREQKIVSFRRDAESGKLLRKAETKCEAEPGVMAISPDRNTLFVALRSSGQIASYRLDAESGELELINTVEGGDDPAYLAVDRSGRFLFTAYYLANKVTVHSIDATGKIGQEPLQTIATAKNAHAIELDAKNRFAWVPHTGGNRIDQFLFDKSTGRLTKNDPAFVSLSAGDEPRHVAVHPTGKWVYANNEAGDSLNVFDVKANGTLRRIQREPTIPATFDPTGNTTARCELTRDGRFVYVANRGHHSIAMFSIDQATGGVRPLGQAETETTPRSFSISADSKFLYAAGQDSGKIAQYEIGGDGALSRIETYAPGSVPWCVLCVTTE